MDQVTGPPRPTIEQLRHVANHFPIIDSHTHNLILPTDSESIPFESITTEAQGRALRDTFKSLPHLRAARQLRQLYECGEDADWEDILGQRVEWLRSNPQELHKRCFEGVHALLVDDGFADPRKVYPYDSHDEYLQAPSKRIVRIETVAERIMQRLLRDAKEDDLGRPKFLPDVWTDFTDDFEREIQDAVRDPEVAAFKSVVCYRTGLDVEPDYEIAARAVGHPFERYVKSSIRKRSYRIKRKPLNDYIVLRTLEILSEKLPHSDSLAKPIQFHAGLGDNDINLLEANPAYLQQLIEAYPSVPFVILHAAYPYTKEASYLTAVYRHVYLDVGEVFPMISRDGQLSVLREALQLAPGSKLLYSSDGHWFPESFYLAHLQFREVWLEILNEYVQKGDITVFQAIAMTKDILFNNANLLYDLRHQAVFDETIRESPKQLTFNTKPGAESPYHSPSMPPIPPAGATTQPATSGPADPRSGSPFAPVSFPPPPKVPQVYDNQIFDGFMRENAGVRFVYVQWLDYRGSLSTRLVPIKEFLRVIHDGERIYASLSEADPMKNSFSPPEIYLEPDLRSLSRTHSKDSLPSASVFCYWRTESGAPLPSCPRTSLEALINNLQYTYSTTLLVGFELTVTFLSRSNNLDRNQQDVYLPLESTSSLPPLLSDILLALDDLSIELQSFYATESSQGRYVFQFTPQPPLLAVDTLIQSRHIIGQIAATHSARTSLDNNVLSSQRMPAPEAASINISLHPPTYDSNFFFGGVVPHLPAICALTLSSDPRSLNEPLTHKKSGNWTFSCFDSLANPYFALSALLAAGILGLQASAGTVMGLEGLHGLGANVPRNVNEAKSALNADGALRQSLGEDVVAAVLGLNERHDGGAYQQSMRPPGQFDHDDRRDMTSAQGGIYDQQGRASSAYRETTPAHGGLEHDDNRERMVAQPGFEDSQRRGRSPYDTAMGGQPGYEHDERVKKERMEERERAEEEERMRDAARRQETERRQELERRQEAERRQETERAQRAEAERGQRAETTERAGRRVGFDHDDDDDDDTSSEDAHEK